MKLTLQYALFGMALLVLTSCDTLRQEVEDPLVSRWADKILNEKETAE